MFVFTFYGKGGALGVFAELPPSALSPARARSVARVIVEVISDEAATCSSQKRSGGVMNKSRLAVV